MKRGCERKREFVKSMEEGDEVGPQVTSILVSVYRPRGRQNVPVTPPNIYPLEPFRRYDERGPKDANMSEGFQSHHPYFSLPSSAPVERVSVWKICQ